jgi:hypothetical protein
MLMAANNTRCLMTATMIKTGFAAVAAMALALGFTPVAVAQNKDGGKIVCWKDKTGKVVGCGDKMPAGIYEQRNQRVDKGGNDARPANRPKRPADAKRWSRNRVRPRRKNKNA